MHTVAQFLSLSNKIKLIQFPGLCLPNLLFFLYWVSDSRTFIGFFFCVKKKKKSLIYLVECKKSAGFLGKKKKNTVSKKKKKNKLFYKGSLILAHLFGFCVKNH